MKKAFVIFALCLVLALVCAAGLALPVYQTRDQVAVTSVTLSGDPAAAQGFTARQSAHYKNHLIWDMTIPLAQPGESVTQVSYDPTAVDWEIDSPTGNSVLYIDAFHNTGWGIETQEDLDHVLEIYPELNPLRPVIQGLLESSSPGETVSRTITLADYFACYPFSVNFSVDEGMYFRSDRDSQQAMSQAFQDYFPLPVDPEETWDIVFWEDSRRGHFLHLRAGNPPTFDPYLLSSYREDDLFFTFFLDSAHGVSFEDVPGGFGLYHIDLREEGEELVLEPDTIRTVYSLPQEAVVLDLTFNHDKSLLLLTYCLGEEYTCLVLDPDTMSPRQELTFPAKPPAEATVHTWDDIAGEEISYPVMTWDGGDTLCGENFLLLYGDETFHLYSLEPEGYLYQFSGPTQEHMILGQYDYLAGAWSGEKLALGSATAEFQAWERTTGLALSVFESGELVYQGTYETSLDDLSTPEARDRDMNSPELGWDDIIHLRKDHELALSWTG